MDCLDQHVREAVRAAVRGATRVGVLATGGLDSSVVAAVAAEVTGRPPLLVSIRGGLCGDLESDLQNDLASELDGDHLILDDIPPFTLDPLFRLNRGCDLPRGGVFSHVWDQACALAADAGADVLLTGEGGDELFGAGPALAAGLLAGGRLFAAAAVLGRGRRSDDAGYVSGLVRQLSSRAFLPALTQPTGAEMALRWRGTYAADAPAATVRRTAQLARLRGAGGLSAAAAVRAVWLERPDLHAAADSEARISCRWPLAESQALADCVDAIPPSSFAPVRVGCQDKHLLRLVARRRLPARITEQRKVGVVNQISVLLRGIERLPHRDRLTAAAAWLGVTLDDAFWRPSVLPAELGLDWTRLLALCAWADNADDRR
ncbi:asparagine synthase-related protein [Streptomyces sp. NPDC058145]|uniref:asparagine synthase-related protein n=1 Tax=Streptomyces sp. NPDC058145 TaxID=3346356 RepID=UPI0036EF9AFD